MAGRLPVAKQPISFAHMTEEHIPLFRAWLQKPHVAEWWHHEPESVIRERLRQHDHRYLFIPAIDGQPAGYVQVYQAESDPATLGLDMFIGEERYLRQGYGSAILKAVVDFLLVESDIQQLIVDPNPKNQHAIRCYQKAGFKPVKEIMTPDGIALLMRISKNAA
jgi:RimJ/RimL family protein N-acetyltransferase